jgi:hypothetical protein
LGIYIFFLTVVILFLRVFGFWSILFIFGFIHSEFPYSAKILRKKKKRTIEKHKKIEEKEGVLCVGS